VLLEPKSLGSNIGEIILHHENNVKKSGCAVAEALALVLCILAMCCLPASCSKHFCWCIGGGVVVLHCNSHIIQKVMDVTTSPWKIGRLLMLQPD